MYNSNQGQTKGKDEHSMNSEVFMDQNIRKLL